MRKSCLLPHPGRLRPLLAVVLLVLSISGAWAQQQRPAKAVPAVVPRVNSDGRQTTNVLADTSRAARGTRLVSAIDTSAAGDSLRVGAEVKGDIKTTVKYSAKDSIRFDVQKKVAYLYDEANVDYGDLSLKAAVITVDYGQNLLKANGAPDSAGKVQGRPVFKDAGGLYQAGTINYNFKTRKGKIADAVTQQGEGYVHAGIVKKNALNEIFGRNGQYTTCNLEHPHFHINATKMKVIPGEKVVTGPFNLVVSDIQTPLGFLFGYFPTPGKSRASGLIFPTFGQSADRGFFLRNGGYYFAPNEYIGLRLTGDVYGGNAEAFGGFALRGEMQYIKRYNYNGLLSIDYTQRPANLILRSEALNTNVEFRRPRSPKTIWINWSHTPTPRPGGGRFSASVQAGSTDYNQQNSFDTRRYLTPSFNSTISYQKQIRNSPINYSLQLSQNQNTQTGVMNFVLPDVSVQVARQYPYQWFGIEPKGRFYDQFYEQIAITYNLIGRNEISNSEQPRLLNGGVIPVIGGTATGRTIPFDFSNLAPLLNNAQPTVQHQFGITLGNYTVLKYLSLNPTINYGESWYFKRLNYKFEPEAQAVRIDTVSQFGRLYNYSGGASLSTNIYGILPIKGAKIEAIRHKITPSVSYSYAPDFSRNDNFYESNLNLGALRDAQGRLYNQFGQQNDITRNPIAFSRFIGAAAGNANGRASSAVTIGLQNQIEMKVRSKNDTTGTTPFEKVSLIDGLDFNTGYDFAADSLNLLPLAVTFRTQVAKKLNIVVNAGFVFYQRDSTGRFINEYLFNQPKRRLAQLTTATLNLSYQFNPAAGTKKSAVARDVAPANDPVLGNPVRVDPYEDYVDFDIPWELSTSFGATYQDPGPIPGRPNRPRADALTVASLNLSGSVKLTQNLRVGYSSGYDFRSNQVSFTSLDFYRDLHCWQISGSWFPFGIRQGYNVTIAAKSSLLQDLKLNRNRTFQNR
ncbi:LPS-assembly protein LptD [Hymenobacter qilianensis]|uniref:LPS-assembly protein LptD n=1 Tax=Hymenobacter qilianensis TaxID=1385715 RepID=A0A7H0GRB5_9BACT|nr:putative LPS assembly protein LptD [Hymenobacter qilianensis]QNP50831.1 LPS-assembly protein LptD [Hymenobacter qilianensis]